MVSGAVVSQSFSRICAGRKMYLQVFLGDGSIEKKNWEDIPAGTEGKLKKQIVASPNVI